MVVEPTRELAAHLMRDSVAVLSRLTDVAESCVWLAVKGVEIPMLNELIQATILTGIPSEMYDTLSFEEGRFKFIVEDT